ncbi:MAG: PQQ-binding-like beta-propeller repeat protein [Planctomycetota bacterium]
MRTILLLILTVVLITGPLQGQSADDLARLRAKRDALVKRLADGRSAGDGVLQLHLPLAAEGFAVQMQLPLQAGKILAGTAAIPWWRQETQKEKFSFLYRDGGQSIQRDKFHYPVQADSLQWNNGLLSGTGSLQVRLDLLRDRRMAPGGRHLYTTDGRWSLLDQWYLGPRTVPRTQQFRIDAQLQKDIHRVHLRIEDGIDSRPLVLTTTLPAGPWQDTRVTAPTWNAGVHRADASGLRIKDGRLTGQLRVQLNPDAWFPKQTWYAVYEMDLAIRDGRVSGTCSATVSEGGYAKIVGQNKTGTRPTRQGPADFSSQVRGAVLTALQGKAGSTGPLGDRVMELEGGLLPAASDPSDWLAEPQGPPARQATVLYNQIRAVQMVLDSPVRCLPEALEACRRPWPQFPADTEEQETAYVARLTRWALTDSDAPAVVTADNPHFGPFFGPVALEGPSLPDAVAADGPQQWRFIRNWQILGPLAQKPSLPGPVSCLPDIVPASAAAVPAEADQLGDNYRGPEQIRWQEQPASGWGVLQPPCWSWDKKGKPTGQPGRQDSSWMARTVLQSPQNQTVWLAMESRDEATLWVNGRLAMPPAPVQRSFNQPGPRVVAVPLSKGPNELLVMVRDDRAESFLKLSVCIGGSSLSADKPATPLAARDDKPQSPRPPYFWDIDSRTNVAWSQSIEQAAGQPLPIGNRILISARPHWLVCLDAATGRELWRSKADVADLLGEQVAKAFQQAGSEDRKALIEQHLGREFVRSAGTITPPLWDGQRAIVHVPTGLLACFDASGKQLWSLRTHMPDASIRLVDNRIIVEGIATDAWARQNGLADRDLDLQSRKTVRSGHNYGRSENDTLRRLQEARSGHHGMMAVGADGKVLWAQPLVGRYAGAPLLLDLPRSPGRSKGVLVTRTAQAVDPADGRILRDRIAMGYWDWLSATSAGNRLYSAWEGGRAGAELWLSPAGVGCKHLFAADRMHAYVAGGPNEGTADRQRYYVWRRVWEHAKHSPAYSLQLDVFDAASGRRIDWIKPAIRHTNRARKPVKIGGLLYLPDDRGGPHTGGTPQQRHVTVVDVSAEQAVLLARNPTSGYSDGPVAIDNDLLLRCGDTIHRIAEGPAGAKQSLTAAARTILERIYEDSPDDRTALKPEPLAEKPPGLVPITQLQPGRDLVRWATAGPFGISATPPDSPVGAVGQPIVVDGVSRRLSALQPERIYWKTSFHNDSRLDDWQVRRTEARIDLDGLSDDPRQAYLMGTVLHNDSRRLIYSTMDAPGVAVFLAGQGLAPGQPVDLLPGYYPLWIRVEPARFQPVQPLGPVSVTGALQAKAASGINWPDKWTVFGPIPEAAGALDRKQLQQLPDRLEVGSRSFPAMPLAAIGRSLDFTALIDLPEGQSPKPASSVQTRPVKQSQSAWAMAKIKAPADGHLVINASADWFMEWFVDGQPVYSTLEKGNGRNPLQLDAHSFAVPVTKGSHTLAVRVKPGSKGWSMTSLGAWVAGNPNELAEKYPAANGQASAAREWRVRLNFRQIDDPSAVRAEQIRQIRRAKPWLQRIAEEIPETSEGRRAETLLQRLESD